MRKGVHPLLRVLVGVGVLGGLALLPPFFLTPNRASNDRIAASTLKTVASAQADFLANDRNANGQRDFWRQDIAGLYGLKVQEEMIKLIELSTAGADAAAVLDLCTVLALSPKAGYWFRALRFADEMPGTLDTLRFAATAYPATPTAGKWMFVLREDHVVWRKAAIPGGPPIFPVDPAQEGWERVP